jgi:hypothetical protein
MEVDRRPEGSIKKEPLVVLSMGSYTNEAREGKPFPKKKN